VKKFINDPNAVARQAVEGLALSYPHLVRQLDGISAVVRLDSPIRGKVAVVTGGGSGHEPMFVGYVGRGWADASVAGNVFASPPPQPIYETAKSVDGGAGILFLYGNYSGDVLNFDMAAEMLEAEGIHVSTVRITDDVASAPPNQLEERRGIAGDFFVIKVAAARAEERVALADVVASAEKANAATRSIGVSLSSCIIPASGHPIFQIPDDQMEIGMGLHGEPGVRRGPLLSADEVACDVITRIAAERAFDGKEVALLVNGLGATPLEELLIVSRAAHGFLKEAGIVTVRSYVGNFATSLDMAGCSISLMWLDDELKRLLLSPAESPALTQV